MGIWIRSQNKSILIECNTVYIDFIDEHNNEYYNSKYSDSLLGKYIIRANDEIMLGAYSTEQKARKVVDMIQDSITFNIQTASFGNMACYENQCHLAKTAVFQMPLDEEMK